MKKVVVSCWLLVVGAMFSAVGEEETFARATGASMRLDTRQGARIAAMGASETVTYSLRWGTDGHAGRVTLPGCTVTADGVTLKTASEEGEVEWSPTSTGAHVLTHTAGDVTYTAQFTVLGDDVAQHDGVLAANETWGSNKVHLVTGALTVPSGKTLTIEPGTVVKFMTGTSLTVNGTCTAYGVIFTHVNDDSVGGDTLMDGDAAKPVVDGYKLMGNIDIGPCEWKHDDAGNALIQTADDLVRLQQWVAVGKSTVGMTFLQTADIDLGDMTWPGIGARDQKDNVSNLGFASGAFCGTYDGQDHMIANVKLLAGDYDGFFNSLYRAEVRNLKMSIRDNGVDTETCDPAYVTDHTMAVFVGVARESTLQNLETVRGWTNGASEFKCYKDAAGIVGLVADGTVASCVNNLDITFGTANNRKGAGVVLLTQNGSQIVTITNCMNAGKIRCDSCASNGLGGILGLPIMPTSIEGCTNSGVLEAAVPDGSKIGTIVGRDNYRVGVNYVTVTDNRAQPELPASGSPVDGLNFAIVTNGVAKLVPNDALALGGAYKVMTSIPTHAFHFAEAGEISIDVALNPDFRLLVTADDGLELSMSQTGSVQTYSAVSTEDPAVTTHTVTFDFGEHGSPTGGGELVQTVTNGCAAVAPIVIPHQGWRFDGWDKDFSCVTNDLTVTAKYSRMAMQPIANDPTGRDWHVGDTYEYEIPTPVTEGGTQLVLMAWSAWNHTSRNVIASNTNSKVWFELANEGPYGIDFAWTTNHWLEIVSPTNGLGRIEGATNGWYAAGSEQTLVAIPEGKGEFMGWTGDTDGCTVTNDGDVLIVPMDRARRIGAEFDVFVPTALTLTPLGNSVSENSTAGLRVRLSRSGRTQKPLSVSLKTTDGQLFVPSLVEIPAGNASTIFSVFPVDNKKVDGDRNVALEASAVGAEDGICEIEIVDDEIPSLVMSLSTDKLSEGGEKITVTVTRELVTDEPLTVYLTGALANRCTCPSTVTIPAGAASVTFEIVAVNDDVARIAAEMTLRASAAGYVPAAKTFVVEDDDVPGVTLTLTPDVVSEGAGQQAIYATLARSDEKQIDKAVRVKLTPSAANQLIMPGEIMIPEYTMSVRFAIGVVDNGLHDGDREVTIDGAIVIESCGCSGQPSNGDVIQAVVGIIDNDGPSLSLTASPATMKDGVNPAGYLTLSHNSVLDEDLTVRLWVDAENEDELVIPETVVIPAGQTSVQVPVQTLDDGVTDGGQLISIYVEDETGVFAPASTWVQVSDQNLPDLVVRSVAPDDGQLIAKGSLKVAFEIANAGFANLAKVVPYRIHLVKGGRRATLASDTVVGVGSCTEGVGAGAVVGVSTTVKLPEMPGDYRIAVELDPDGFVSELDKLNNIGWSNPLAVGAEYVASATVAQSTYVQGQGIYISGVATLANGVDPAANRPIEVYVCLDGTRRSISAQTDANGGFSVLFEPTSGEAGHYTVGACYPNSGLSAPMASFDILGLQRTSSDWVIWDVSLSDVETRTVNLKNRCSVPLTGVNVTLMDVPEACDIKVVVPDSIPPYGVIPLALTATAKGITDKVDYEKLHVRVTTAEGAVLEFPAYFHSQSQQACLRVVPSAIDSTMTVGQTRTVAVNIVNDGKGDSGVISVGLPDNVRWLDVEGGKTLPSLKQGESTEMRLLIAPSDEDGLVLNAPYRGGSMSFSCANGKGCVVPLSFTPVSESTGRIVVDAWDDNTQWLAEAPHLAGANVKILNPYTRAVVATGFTDEKGLWRSPDVSAGEYELSVSADRHDACSKTVVIEPGRTSETTAYLKYQVVSMSWKVEKTEIEDSYDIKLVVDFETRVPAPVVKTVMPTELPVLNAGETYAFNVTLSNEGVLAAETVTITMPEIPGYSFTLSDNAIYLPAKATKQIAVVFKRNDIVKNSRPRLLAADDSGADGSRGDDVHECLRWAQVDVKWICPHGPHDPKDAFAVSVYDYVVELRHGECPTRYITGDPWPKFPDFPDGDDDDDPGRTSSTNTPGAKPIKPPAPVVRQWHECDPCISALLNALHGIGGDLWRFARETMISEIPFMSCVDFVINTLMTVSPEVETFVNDVTSAEGLSIFLEGHFSSYADEGRNTLAEGVIDGVLDLASCGLDVGIAALEGVSGGTATPVAISGRAAMRRWLDGLKTGKKIVEPIAEINGWKNNTRQLYKDLLRHGFDPESEYGRAILVNCFSTGETVEHIQSNVVDLVVLEGGVNNLTNLHQTITGPLDDGTVSDIDVMNVVGDVMAEAKSNESHLVDPEVIVRENPSVDADKIRDYVARWNRSVKAWLNDGKITRDGFDFGNLIYQAVELKMAKDYIKSRGYESFSDAATRIFDWFDDLTSDASDRVCASVSLQLSQSVAMTREAFNGTLTLYNGNELTPMRDLKMEVSVLDEDGNECRDLFVMNNLGTSGAMSSGWIVDGGLSVSAGGTGSAVVQFIPSHNAAPTNEKVYRFGGTVTYTDPFSGKTATVNLTPVALTVSPSPYLNLHYFIQRDVYADDPMTERVEASMSAEMAVLVVNTGAGDAKNVTISSVQPEVVKNEKGLDVGFSMKDYSLDATALNGSTAHLGLNAVALGTIPAGESQVAQWWLTSSIQGHFTKMSASVAPVNSWNTPDTVLVDPDVGMHKLIRSLAVEGEKKPYFLTSENSDLYGTPDTIYDSNGASETVRNDGAVSVSGTLIGATPTLTMTVGVRGSGWNYVKAAIPGLFRYEIVSIVRSDGSTIPIRNAWITDRTFRDSKDPILEEQLHLADDCAEAGTRAYTVSLKAKPTDIPEVLSFDGVEDGGVEYAVRDEVLVAFTKEIDFATFTTDDIVLKNQGVRVNDLEGVSISAVEGSAAKYRISGLSALCNAHGRYELTVQCAGIADLSGQFGSAGKSVSWSYALPDSPYIINAVGIPVVRVKMFDGFTTVVSVPVTEESARAMTVRLNGVDVTDRVVVAPADETGTRFDIQGLEALQTVDGEYVLEVDGANLRGIDGGEGVNVFRSSWVRDTVAPKLNSVERSVGLNGQEFKVALSEDVAASSISLANVRLTWRDSRPPLESRNLLAANDCPIELPASTRMVARGDGVYSVTGFDSATLADGTYTLSFDAEGVADEAGNEASGVKSVSWTVDTTPPSAVQNLSTSSEYGSVETCVYTTSRNLTISGTVPEANVSVRILAKFVGGSEVLLAEPELDANLSFSEVVELPGDGNMTIIVRLTDAAGNSSDSAFDVYVDIIALEATLTGVPAAGEPAGTLTLTFSAEPEEATVLAAAKTLTFNGGAVEIPNVGIEKVGDKTYSITGLAEYTADYGAYAFSFDATTVKKALSGKTGSSTVVLAWDCIWQDKTPPQIAEVLFGGEAPVSAYADHEMFSQISVRFTEAVNVPALIESELIGSALRIELLNEENAIAGIIKAENVSWDEQTFTAAWTIDQTQVPCGRARLVVDSSLVEDMSGNKLAVSGGFDVISSHKTFSPSLLKSGVADAYACPALTDWNGDGLLDLVVGEETADMKGKVRVYLNRGTKENPVYDDYTYLKIGDEDVEFEAQGCVGMQVSFGRVRGASMVLAASNGEIYGWRHRAKSLKTKEPYPMELIFDRMTDARFASLIRTQTFCCDIDGDGSDEIVVSGQNSPMFWLKRIGLGEETRVECTPLMDPHGERLAFPEGQNHTSAVLFDVNGDTILDLVTGDTTGNVWVYLGTENGRFAATPTKVYENAQTSNTRSRLAVGDIDGDGVEDILVGRKDGSILKLKGEAKLAPAVNFKRVELKSVEQALGEDLFWVNGADGWVCQQSGESAQAFASHASDGEITLLVARFGGKGTVTFTWSVSGADDNSAFTCVGGDSPIEKFGSFTSVAQSVVVSTDGSHQFVWTFTGRGKAVISDVGFAPEMPETQVTQTSAVPIKFADIRRFANSIWKEKGGDYEAAVTSIAANGKTVEENCIAGVDSSDPNAAYRTVIEVVNGVPQVSPDPDLGDERVYTFWGRESLKDGDWKVITVEEVPLMRFFKVDVRMP